MTLKPSDLAGKPITLDASLLGAHVIMAPQADRILAILLTSQFRQYTLFIRQSADNRVELEVEETIAPDSTHPASARERAISRPR